MKKIIIPNNLLHVIENEKDQGFLNRAEISVLVSTSNEDAIRIHREQRVNLIIASTDTSGMDAETMCSTIRDDLELRKVSILVICEEDCDEGKKIKQCRANDFLKKPASGEVLLEKVQKLLDIAMRMSLRVPIGVKVEGSHGDEPFLGYSMNVSASGMLFESDKLLDIQEGVKCSFLLPDLSHITVNARIVRIVKGLSDYDVNQYGVTFLDLSEQGRFAIEAYVREQKEG